jgi:hypothetical protein
MRRGLWLAFLVGCGPTAQRPPPVLSRAPALAPDDPTVSPEHMADAPVLEPRPEAALIAAASDGTDHLVLYAADTVRAVRIRADGSLLDPTGIKTAATDDVALGFDGTRYVVTWLARTPSGRELMLQRIGSDGTVAPPKALEMVNATSPRFGGIASNTDGTSLIVWDTPTMLYGLRVDAGDNVLDSAPLLIAASTLNPASVASDGTDFFVGWGASANFAHARVVHADGTLGADVTLQQGGSFERDIRVAYGDLRYLLTWVDGLPSHSQIWGVRFDRSGTPVDLGALSIESGTDPWQAAIVWRGSDFLIGWHNLLEFGSPSPLYARGFGATATVAGARFMIANGYPVAQPVVLSANDSGTAFAAWNTYDFLEGTRVGTASPIDSPPLTLAFEPNAEWQPLAASDGSAYLVVWSDQRRHGSPPVIERRVRGAIVGPDGIATSTTGIDFGAGWAYGLVYADGAYLLSSASDSGTNLMRIGRGGAIIQTSTAPGAGAMAHDPIDHRTLIAWTQGDVIDEVTLEWNVAVAVVDATGRVLRSQRITPIDGDDELGGVAFDGADFVVSWTHTATIVRMTRVAPDGTLVDPSTGVPICTAPGARSGPTLARVGGSLLAAWRDSRGDRIYGTWIERGAPSDPNGFPITSTIAGGSPVLADDTEDAILLWPNASTALEASWVTSTSTVLHADGVPIDPRAHPNDYAVASAGAARALVAYASPSPDVPRVSRVYLRLVTLHGSAPDAGAGDAPEPDGQTMPDVGSVDAGGPASVEDAGDAEIAYAESTDSEALGSRDGGPSAAEISEGCHCRAGGARSGASAWALLFIATAFMLGRRAGIRPSRARSALSARSDAPGQSARIPRTPSAAARRRRHGRRCT